MFVLTAVEKDLALKFERSNNLPHYVNADATKLRQALINLIGNALKFTVSGGITVSVKQTSDEGNSEPSQVKLRFEVADTGPGISAEDIPRLFEAFTQTSTGLKAHEGSGLGLAISRKIVRLMGGDITVSSQPGHGTIFTFDIVCQLAPATEVQAAWSRQPIIGLALDQPKYRILVVDDKWTNRQLLIRLLAPLGFELREAEDGQEAISISQSFKPHLIWMDIRMPVMDGLEALDDSNLRQRVNQSLSSH